MGAFQYQEQIAARWTVYAELIKPPTRLKPSEWAGEYRKLSKESSAKGGGSWRSFCYQVEPMDAPLEPDVITTVLMWASQTGKTEVINTQIGYFIHQDPAPMLMIQPTLEMADTWSKRRFSPMVRDTECLKALVQEGRQKDSSSTIREKSYPGGQITIAGANSPASLASRPVRVTAFDEVDRFPASAGDEGDPILLAEKRSESWWNSVSIKTSTPTIRGKSRIEKEFEQSDKRYWFCKCPYCDHMQTLKWRNVRWEEGRPDTAYIECEGEECKRHWDDKDRRKAIAAGMWIATAPFTGTRGYHLNGIYSLFKVKKGYRDRLHQMVAQFLNAKALGKDGLQTWVNTFLAETWQDEVDHKPEWGNLFARKEDYDDQRVPAGVCLVSAGVDFQMDRIEVEFVGFGDGEQTWGLGHHVLWGDPRMPDMYTILEQLLLKIFKRVDGARLKLACAGFDTSYAACQRQLYSWLRPRLIRRYYAFKGSSELDAEPISRSSKSKVERVTLIMVGTNRIKTFIYTFATIEADGPGKMHFPLSYTEDWFKQLLAEESTQVYRAGRNIRVFEMPDVTPPGGTNRNEALDCRVYAHGAVYARGVPNWQFEEKRAKDTIPTHDEEGVVIEKKRGRRRKTVGGSSLLAGLGITNY